MDKTEALGKKPIGQLLAEFSIPAIGSLLVISLYNLIDRVFIGQGTGVAGIAAVTAAYPIMLTSMSVGVLFSTGARSLASLELGKGNTRKAEAYIGQATAYSILFSILLSIVIWITSGNLLLAVGATETSVKAAKEYLVGILLGAPAQAAFMSASTALSIEGRPRAAFMTQLSGTIMNAVLAPIFIFVLGWGVGGAGFAVAIAQGTAFVVTLLYMRSPKSRIKLEFNNLYFDWRSLAATIRVGAPMFFFQLLTSATLVVANNAIRPIGGDLGLAVVGVVIAIGQFLGFPLFGVITAAQPLWGFNYGARKWDRIKHLSMLVFVWTIGFAAASELATFVFPNFFVSLFSNESAFVAKAASALRIFMLGFVLFPLEFAPALYFQATGRASPALVMMLLRFFSFIAGMIVLPRFLGFDGVIWAGPISDALTGSAAVVLAIKMKLEIRRKLGESLPSLQS